jgi:2-oxoglutarate dehydrogenase E2 component (dihydrolipoamide succinyltransferase)
MATDIVIPALGESITEGVIASWLVAEGEHVERDQPVLELETDKITMELPAPASGVVSHKAAEGDTVEVGAVVGGIDESAAPAAKTQSDAKADAKKAASEQAADKGAVQGAATAASVGAAPAADPAKQQLPSRANRGPVGTPPPVLNMPSGPMSSGPISDDDVAATPLARKIAHERNVDLHSLTGTRPIRTARPQPPPPQARRRPRNPAARARPRARRCRRSASASPRDSSRRNTPLRCSRPSTSAT